MFATVGILAAAAVTLAFAALRWSRHSTDPAFDRGLARDDWRTPSGTEQAALSPAQRGRMVFVSNCLACHQADGAGLPGLYPPLAHSDWVQGAEPRIVRVLLDGLQGPVAVRGANFDSIMPAFRGLLSDDDMAAVLTHVRGSWGNEATAITSETVHSIRERTAGRTSSWTAAELAGSP